MRGLTICVLIFPNGWVNIWDGDFGVRFMYAPRMRRRQPRGRLDHRAVVVESERGDSQESNPQECAEFHGCAQGKGYQADCPDD